MRADFMVTSKSPGFTLIELMVAVAIIGILAAIAIPSYEQYIKRGIRTDAKSALLKNAQFLERNYTEANQFDEDSGGDAIALPNTVSPESGTTLYQISTSDLTDTTFTLQAAPVAGQRMENDECGTFTLNHLGQKGVSGATLSAEDCWNR